MIEPDPPKALPQGQLPQDDARMSTDSPHWIVLLIATALVTAFVSALMTHAMPTWLRLTKSASRGVARRMNRYRKIVLARRPTRQDTRRDLLANWRRAPLWLLRTTLFRWYEENPSEEWAHVKTVYDQHRRAEVKQHAKSLLWEDRPAEELRVGDAFGNDEHVLFGASNGDRVLIVTDADMQPDGTSSYLSWTTPSASSLVRVKRGWCSRDNCKYCTLTQKERRSLSDGILNLRTTPGGDTHWRLDDTVRLAHRS